MSEGLESDLDQMYLVEVSLNSFIQLHYFQFYLSFPPHLCNIYTEEQSYITQKPVCLKREPINKWHG